MSEILNSLILHECNLCQTEHKACSIGFRDLILQGNRYFRLSLAILLSPSGLHFINMHSYVCHKASHNPLKASWTIFV